MFRTFHNEAMNEQCKILRLLLKQILYYFSILIQRMNKLPIIVNLKHKHKIFELIDLEHEIQTKQKKPNISNENKKKSYIFLGYFHVHVHNFFSTVIVSP